MPDNKRESPSFLNVISNAREIPEGIDPLAERDSPAPLEGDKKSLPLVGSPMQDELDQLGAQVNCLQFSKVFVIWRPWESCKPCLQKISEMPEVLPAVGVYTCPHTNGAEYKEAVDRCLSGKGAVATKEFFNLKNGTRCVHLEWLETDPVYIEKAKREAAIAAENRVYPPNPEAAFKRGKKKERSDA